MVQVLSTHQTMCQREWGDNVAYVEICAVTADLFLWDSVAPVAEVACAVAWHRTEFLEAITQPETMRKLK